MNVTERESTEQGSWPGAIVAITLFVEDLARPDFILPHLILNVELPVLVVGLFCAGALAASMSTGDALLHATASVAVEDGVRPFVRLPDATPRLLMRALVVVAGGLAYLFALDEARSLVMLLLSSYGIIAQLAPPIVAAMYWRRATTAGAVAGLVAGSAVTLFFFLVPALAPFGIHEGILGLAVHLPVLVGVSLATRPQPDAHTALYTDPALR
jgi:solute:Na+ symporter, SSS family